MKKFSLIGIYSLLLVCFIACKGHQVSNLHLDGNCDVLAFEADSFMSTIDLVKGNIEVWLPVDRAKSPLTITKLTLSPGATATFAEGQVLNLQENKRMVVRNGDVYRDWNISAIHETADILYFDINGKYVGEIDNQTHTINVVVPHSLKLNALIFNLKLSYGASSNPKTGSLMDFTNPVHIVVETPNLSNDYTVIVKQMDNPNPKALFLGTAKSQKGLCPEDSMACQWLLNNVDGALYASLADIRDGVYDLSDCKFIWWHMHSDVTIDSQSKFEAAADGVTSAIQNLQKYYAAGGNLLLTRFATYLPAYLSINGNMQTMLYPNNCWAGHPEIEAESVSGKWAFKATGHANHPMFANLQNDGNPEVIYTCSPGYYMTNTAAQWHIGTDWGGLATYEDFRSKTGARDLAYDNGAVVVWEFVPTSTCGTILCVGSACYDWYSIGNQYVGYYQNVPKMTMNAINYITGK